MSSSTLFKTPHCLASPLSLLPSPRTVSHTLYTAMCCMSPDAYCPVAAKMPSRSRVIDDLRRLLALRGTSPSWLREVSASLTSPGLRIPGVSHFEGSGDRDASCLLRRVNWRSRKEAGTLPLARVGVLVERLLRLCADLIDGVLLSHRHPGRQNWPGALHEASDFCGNASSRWMLQMRHAPHWHARTRLSPSLHADGAGPQWPGPTSNRRALVSVALQMAKCVAVSGG